MGKPSGFTLLETLIALTVVTLAAACGVAVSEQQTLPGGSQTPVSSPQPRLGVSLTSAVAHLPLILTVTPTKAAQADDVQLTLSHTTAVPGQPITVTVTNHAPSTIATFDHKSLCSIFSIQRRNEDEWENVLECPLEKRTIAIAIPPGDSKSLTFNGGSHFLDPGALDPGVYRVEFEYKRVDDLEDLFSDEILWQTVHSPILTITGQTDDVQLTLSDTTARPGQPITVTVTNRSSSPIATFDHQSLCSIFTIQKQDEDEWENVLECLLKSPTVPVAIPPGDSRSLAFNGGSHFLDPGALDPGMYRVEFVYKQVEDVKGLFSNEISWQTVYSPLLTIGCGPYRIEPVTPHISGPFHSKPVTPFVFDGDLRELPTVEPSEPGEPIREAPRGLLTPETGGINNQ